MGEFRRAGQLQSARFVQPSTSAPSSLAICGKAIRSPVVDLLQVAAVRVGHLGQAQFGGIEPADRSRAATSERIVRDPVEPLFERVPLPEGECSSRAERSALPINGVLAVRYLTPRERGREQTRSFPAQARCRGNNVGTKNMRLNSTLWCCLRLLGANLLHRDQ